MENVHNYNLLHIQWIIKHYVMRSRRFEILCWCLTQMHSEHPCHIFDVSIISLSYRGHGNYIYPHSNGCSSQHLPSSLQRYPSTWSFSKWITVSITTLTVPLAECGQNGKARLNWCDWEWPKMGRNRSCSYIHTHADRGQGLTVSPFLIRSLPEGENAEKVCQSLPMPPHPSGEWPRKHASKHWSMRRCR